MKKLLALSLFVVLALAGCSGQTSRASLLEAMLEKVAEIETYQLDAEMELGGQVYKVQQWFVGPDKLRTVMAQSNGLEQIVIADGSNTLAYYSATKQWVVVSDASSGPFPLGLPLLMLLAEMAKENIHLTDTFSAVKASVRGSSGWDSCEVVISKRTRLPESCTLVKGKDSVNIRFTSVVTNLKISDELFKTGR